MGEDFYWFSKNVHQEDIKVAILSNGQVLEALDLLSCLQAKILAQNIAISFNWTSAMISENVLIYPVKHNDSG